MNEKNIVLIGMPGAGKSTLGVLLAKVLNYDFLDADIAIQKREGRKLYEIIDQVGIDEFLRIENDVITDINVNKTVIATGGSAIYGKEAMVHMKSTGILVYIKLSCEEIQRRVNNITTRGIAMKKGETLADVFDERAPIYESYADIVISCDNTSIEEAVALLNDEIVNYL